MLTQDQISAINHVRGPALVIAGPGAGKTFVITERVKKLIEEHCVDPKTILVTTFTEKAADELKIRLARTLGKRAELIHISTIHSFCKAMLEKYFLHHEYGSEIKILDAEAQKLLIEVNKFKFGISRWENGQPHDAKRVRGFLNSVRSFYDTITQNNIDPQQLLAAIESTAEAGDAEIISGYQHYRELLREEKLLDFTMLQTKFYELITSKPNVLADVQSFFEFILVDEYQDTSPIQDSIFRLIAGEKKNIFVVGDENQSIYAFRGASIRNFREFLTRYPGATSYFLNVNFRSTQVLVNFSNQVFEAEVRKELESRRREGERIRVICGEDMDDAAKQAIQIIKKMKEDGVLQTYGDVALLFRSLKGHATEYIRYLTEENIPHVTFGDGKFLTRSEIRVMIYLISYVTQDQYADNKFWKWQEWWQKDLFLNEFFQFSEETKEIIRHTTSDLYGLHQDEDFAKAGFTNEADITRFKKLNRLKHDIARERDAEGDWDAGNNTVLKIFYKILDYTEYFVRLMAEQTREAHEKLYNLGRLSEIIDRYAQISKRQDVKGFLWYIYTSGEDVDQGKIEHSDTVKLMTVHAAKGMEFPVVFLCNLNEGQFPLRFQQRHLIHIPSEFLVQENIAADEEEFFQEERRLFYVGITRAQDNLIFTHSARIKVNSTHPSRFLQSIPPELISDTDFKIPTERHYEVKKDVPSLNYSAINTFIDCPLRYHLVYDYAFVTPASFRQMLGTFTHNVLQQINESLKRKEDISPAEMKTIVEQYWVDLPMSKEKNTKEKEMLTRRLINYYLFAKEHFSDIIAIEQSFSHIGDNMILKGKVDLIAKENGGKVCLIDFKARRQKGLEETNVDKQLRIYDHCLDTEIKVDKLQAYTIEDNLITEFAPDRKGTESFLYDVGKRMAAEEYPKQKNAFCRQCQFKFYCWGATEKV